MADLKEVGAERYSEDPSTDVLCLLYRIDEDGWHQWLPGDDENRLWHVAVHPDILFVAHNAGFEQAIWRNIMVKVHGFPPIPVERWEDTMATAAYKSLPLALDRVQAALGLPHEKDAEGRALTLSMSKPLTKAAHMAEHPGGMTQAAWAAQFQPGMLPARTPEHMARIVSYCRQDVVVEGAVRKRLGLLSDVSPHERQVWLLDQRINQRGIRLDLDFVRQAKLLVDRATKILREEFIGLTGGIEPGQVEKIRGWAGARGVALDNLQKEYVGKLLREEELDDAGYMSYAGEGDSERGNTGVLLPAEVRRVLEIRGMLGSASVKKLSRMQACVGSDGRARGLLQYHAAHPGRWGGRLLQPQNFPRGGLVGFDGVAAGPECVVAAIMTGDPREVSSRFGKLRPDNSVRMVEPIEVVAASLRHALIPDKGKVFMDGDFAGIEMRVDLALAGAREKCRLLAEGADVYLDMAHAIYKRPLGTLTKANITERTIGKNTVLGCGFQMGAPKFHERYCPEQSLAFAEEVVRAYREDWAPEVPQLWAALKDAAWDLIHGGRSTEVYGCEFRLEDGWMTLRLPSGWQKIWYFDPMMRYQENQHYNQEYAGYKPSYIAYKGGQSKVLHFFGGLLCENVCQGLARGLLVAAMMRLEKAGMPIVLTVHDECLIEIEEGRADLKAFEQCMAEPTAWARDIGIPISVESWRGERYRK